MILGAVVVVGVLTTLGVYASGVVDNFSYNGDKNMATIAQDSVNMLSEQTNDLETSIAGVVKVPFQSASDQDTNIQVAESNESLSDISKFIDEIKNDVTVENNETLITVEELYSDWSSKYNQARNEYLKLSHRIKYAEDNINKYFVTQLNLTNNINDVLLRNERHDYYIAQIDAFAEWQKQSNVILNDTQEVMDRLDDINIIIEQQRLEAYFTSLISPDVYGSIPEALSDLDAELHIYRNQIDNINIMFQNTQTRF